MSDREYDQAFERTLPAARHFYESLSAELEKYHGAKSPSAQEAAGIACREMVESWFQEVSLDDIQTAFYLPHKVALLNFALTQSEKTAGADFDETLYKYTGMYTWHVCSHEISKFAAVMGTDESSLQKRLEKVGYAIKDGVIAHHPGMDANQRYDDAYFNRLSAAARANTSPKI